MHIREEEEGEGEKEEEISIWTRRVFDKCSKDSLLNLSFLAQASCGSPHEARKSLSPAASRTRHRFFL